MKKIRISAFVVFMIGMISILIHMFKLKASSNANPTEVTDLTEDTLATETTTPPRKEYPVVQLANDTYKFNEVEDNIEDESEMNKTIQPFFLSQKKKKETFLLLFI